MARTHRKCKTELVRLPVRAGIKPRLTHVSQMGLRTPPARVSSPSPEERAPSAVARGLAARLLTVDATGAYTARVRTSHHSTTAPGAQTGPDWSAKTGRAMAANLVAVARALATNPVPAPPS